MQQTANGQAALFPQPAPTGPYPEILPVAKAPAGGAEFFPDYPLSRTVRPEPDLRERDGPEYKAFFDQLVADIAERGVQQPILAFRGADAAHVIDGWTRRLASLMAGKTTIPVLLYPDRPESKDRLLGSLQANAMRLDMDDFEYAAVYQELMGECGFATQAELAPVVKASTSLISKRMRMFNGIPQDIRGLFGRGPRKLGGRAAYAISGLPTDDDKREIARLAVERSLKVDVIERLCRDRAGKKTKKARSLTHKDGPACVVLPTNWPGEKIVEWLAARLGAAKDWLRKGVPPEKWGTL
jgi:ParB/RepB/Spo0J family partition protein